MCNSFNIIIKIFSNFFLSVIIFYSKQHYESVLALSFSAELMFYSLWVTVPANCVKRWKKVQFRGWWHLFVFSFMQSWEPRALKADRVENKMCWLQCVIQPPSIGSLLSLSTFTHQRQTSSPQSQNREQVVPRCQKRRTSKQTAGVRCFLCPPAEAQLNCSGHYGGQF